MRTSIHLVKATLPPRRVTTASTASAVSVSAGTTGTTVSTTSAVPSTSPSTTSAPSTSSTSTAVSGHLLKFGRNLVVAFSEDLDEFSSRLGIVGGEKGNGGTFGSGSTGSTDSVDVILEVLHKVISAAQQNNKDSTHIGKVVVDDIYPISTITSPLLTRNILDVFRLKSIL